MEALQLRYGDAVHCEMVDALKDYAPKPLDLAPEHYAFMIKAPQLYRQFYELGNGQRRSKLITNSITLYARRQVKAMMEQHEADVIVSTYHFANAPVLDALRRSGRHTPLITVVTDLITIPPVWFDRRAALTILPTESAFHQAIIAGMPQDKLVRIGLPVSPGFVAVTAVQKAALRRKLGWPTNRRIALMMAGSVGIGPLGSLAEAIVDSGLDVTPVVVTGRNRRLATRLRTEPWANQAHIYDFVDDMPSFMQAADILVTKAGPGTITEALNVHLPMILYSRIPGQEEGNVQYVTASGAGYWAPKKSQLIDTLQYLTTDPKALERAQVAAQHLSNPKAATAIAELVMKTAQENRQK